MHVEIFFRMFKAGDLLRVPVGVVVTEIAEGSGRKGEGVEIESQSGERWRFPSICFAPTISCAAVGSRRGKEKACKMHMLSLANIATLF